MAKFICDINGILLAESGIIHGALARIAGGDTQENKEKDKEGNKSAKANNIAPQRLMHQLLHVHENNAQYLEDVLIPVVSGNALRGILRRLIVEHSFDVLDVSIEELFKDMPNHDKLAHDVWFAFNNGGLTPAGSSVRASSLKAYDEIYSIPWLGLLGAVYYGHQFEGSSSFGILYPLMQENVYLYKDALNLTDDIISKLPSVTLLSTLPVMMNTRRANSRDNSARIGKSEAKEISENSENMMSLDPDSPDAMIYGSEYIPAGVQFASLNRCVTNDENVLKAFKAAMGLFLGTHRIIGGKSAAGFGRVHPSYGFDGLDYKEAIEDYDKMLRDNKDDLIRKIRMIGTELKFKVSSKKAPVGKKEKEKEAE